MHSDRLQFITPIQDAFMRAFMAGAPVKLARKIERALDHNQPRQVRAVNANLSYRTAQKLIKDGAL